MDNSLGIGRLLLLGEDVPGGPIVWEVSSVLCFPSFFPENN